MRRLALVLCLATISAPAHTGTAQTWDAQPRTWTGGARVVDGDTLYVNRTRLRLMSMDAFETRQTCARNGREYPCGRAATQALTKMIAQREVRCAGHKRDRYRRPLVHCWIGTLDLGRQMVRLGWALAEYGREYRADQAFAKAAGAGAWAGSFERPKDWRKAQPRRRTP